MTPKDPAAVALGRKGGKARARSMTKEERRKAAQDAVNARWDKQKAAAAAADEKAPQ